MKLLEHIPTFAEYKAFALYTKLRSCSVREEEYYSWLTYLTEAVQSKVGFYQTHGGMFRWLGGKGKVISHRKDNEDKLYIERAISREAMFARLKKKKLG